MEPSFRSQQNPPELEVIGEQSTPRSTDQDSEENQCQTSVFLETSVAENKKCAVEHDDFTDLPGGEEKEKDRDGSSQEQMEVDNTEQCHGPVSCVEPSTAPAKQRTAKKKKCATEHVDVTHLPGGEKDRDGIVPGRVKDKEDDLDSSQEKNPWGAEKKQNAVQHEDVTHLLGEEKEEEEDRNGFFQENKKVDDTEQCYKPSTAQAKEKMKLGISQHDSWQQQQRQQQQQLQQQLQLRLQHSASHPQPATTSSQSQPPFRRIYRYPNHALWFFPPNISQSKFEGRTSSNACTFIALLMGRSFSVTRNATVNIRNEPSSPQVWLSIVSTAIREGNRVHDDVTGGEAVNFSVEEAIWYLNRDGCFGKTESREYLNVEFTNEDSDRPQASLSYHLGLLSHLGPNIAALVIVNEMTIAFVARGEKLFVFDSHSHPPFGDAIVGVSDMSSRASFLATIKQILGLRNNLCSLSFVEYL